MRRSKRATAGVIIVLVLLETGPVWGQRSGIDQLRRRQRVEVTLPSQQSCVSTVQSVRADRALLRLVATSPACGNKGARFAITPKDVQEITFTHGGIGTKLAASTRDALAITVVIVIASAVGVATESLWAAIGVIVGGSVLFGVRLEKCIDARIRLATADAVHHQVTP